MEYFVCIFVSENETSRRVRGNREERVQLSKFVSSCFFQKNEKECMKNFFVNLKRITEN